MRAPHPIHQAQPIQRALCADRHGALSPITSKCTTCDHFKVHHFGWGFLVDGGVVGKEGMRRREFFWPAAAESLRRTRWRGLEGDGA